MLEARPGDGPGLLCYGVLMLASLLFVRRQLQRSYREWLRWAVDHPEEAALQLEAIADALGHRADNRRRPKGWVARWQRATAYSLRRQATALLEARNDRERKQVCGVRPGAWR